MSAADAFVLQNSSLILLLPPTVTPSLAPFSTISSSAVPALTLAASETASPNSAASSPALPLLPQLVSVSSSTISTDSLTPAQTLLQTALVSQANSSQNLSLPSTSSAAEMNSLTSLFLTTLPSSTTFAGQSSSSEAAQAFAFISSLAGVTSETASAFSPDSLSQNAALATSSSAPAGLVSFSAPTSEQSPTASIFPASSLDAIVSLLLLLLLPSLLSVTGPSSSSPTSSFSPSSSSSSSPSASASASVSSPTFSSSAAATLSSADQASSSSLSFSPFAASSSAVSPSSSTDNLASLSGPWSWSSSALVTDVLSTSASVSESASSSASPSVSNLESELSSDLLPPLIALLTSSSSESSSSARSSSDSSRTSLSSLAGTTLAPSSSRYTTSTISVLPNTTITTVIAIPTSAPTSGSNGSGVLPKNGRIIGGVVGAVGGAVLLGALALLVFLKKRNKSVTNQLPDFAEEALGSDTEKSTGFQRLFGAKGRPLSGGGGVSTYNGLENQVNSKSAALGGGAAAASGNSGDDSGFEYRGVTNSNNLDTVFRSSGANSGRNSSGQNSGPDTPHQGHSRYNSVVAPPMGTMHEGEAQNYQNDSLSNDTAEFAYGTREAPYPTRDEDALSIIVDSEKSSEYGSDEDFLFTPAPHQFFAGEHHSNNSRLRFTEDI